MFESRARVRSIQVSLLTKTAHLQVAAHPARLCPIEVLQYHHTCAFGNNAGVSQLVEGTTGVLRITIPAGSKAITYEACHGERRDRSIRPARHRHFRFT